MHCTINCAVTFCSVERFSTCGLHDKVFESFNASYAAREVFPNEMMDINGHNVSDNFYKGGMCLYALAVTNT
jgi:hypothetical protein